MISKEVSKEILDGFLLQLVAIQFYDIECTIKAAIASCLQNYFVRFHPYEHLEYGCFSLSGIDERTKISLPSKHQTNAFPPLLEIWPIFPNSLLSTEIAASSPCDSSFEATKSEVGKYANEYESDYQYTTSLYYNLQQPVPGYMGKQLYRRGIHIVTFITEEDESIINESPLFRTALTILAKKNTAETLSNSIYLSFVFEYNGSKGERLKDSKIADLSVERYRLADLCHRLNIIGKAYLVLCVSSGVAVDAIRAGVPVVFISDVPEGYEEIQQCFLAFLEHGNYRELINHQARAFRNILARNSMQFYVMSGQKSLHDLINHRIVEYEKFWNLHDSKAFTEHTFIDHGKPSEHFIPRDQDLIIHTPQSLCVKTAGTARLKIGIESNRRKFQKFRESPVRFLEDSKSQLVRSLVNARWTK
ncbi:hypothetical protein OAM69_04125 [bacterium]|nr:hypothetical protein [bacterium]